MKSVKKTFAQNKQTVYGILEKSLLFYILASDSWTSLHLHFIYNRNHINPISYVLLGSKYLSALLFLSRAYPYTSARSAMKVVHIWISHLPQFCISVGSKFRHGQGFLYPFKSLIN